MSFRTDPGFRTETAIGPDRATVFVSLELSRSKWLITALLPRSDKMSKYSVNGGDGTALLDRLARLRAKAQPRIGTAIKIVVIQEAGLDGFWIHRLLESNGIESHVVEPASIAVLLMKLKGIGLEFATVLWLEGLFRSFANRRQLAAYAGLAPSPWQSGRVDREQGISKSGNPRLRTTMVELAWLWLRYQPASALSCWFRERVGSERGRIRRIAIVALARKLLVALWRYTTLGELPKGAALKTA
jgi:transposase